MLPVFESGHQGIRRETREEIGSLAFVRECADELRLSASGRTHDIKPKRIALRPSVCDGCDASVQGSRIPRAERVLVEFHKISVFKLSGFGFDVKLDLRVAPIYREDSCNAF